MFFFGLLLACVTGLYYSCELLFWDQFWEPQSEGAGWQQPLVMLPCSLWVWGVWGRPGWRAGFPPRVITAPSPSPNPHTSPSFGCSSWGQRREGKLCEQGCARHGQSTEPPLQLPLQHCGHIQLWNVFALCFHAPARACPALFHLRNSHSARVRGQSFSVHAVPLQGAHLFHKQLSLCVHLCFWRPHTSAVLERI